MHEHKQYSLAFAGERSWRICFNGSLSVKGIELLYSVVKERLKEEKYLSYIPRWKRGEV